MRESIGGSWLFGIVATFIALFTGFLSYAISYTKAFNVKNQIINYIEHYDGFTGYTGGSSTIYNATDENLENDGTVEAMSFRLIRSSGYNYSVFKDKDNTTCHLKSDETNTGGKLKQGYCIYKRCENGNQHKNTVYKVTAFVAIKLPVIDFMIKIPVSGETRTISTDRSSEPCSNNNS